LRSGDHKYPEKFIALGPFFVHIRSKVGSAFATGGSISSGKEITMTAILEGILINKMIATGGGGSFGLGASATTGPDSPGIDERN
jgi:NAD(P)H dehydrogenase (quinone)